MKIEIDVTRWLDPNDDYSIEMLAPGSPMVPLVQQLEKITLVNLVSHLRTHHPDDSRAVALLLEAIDETCGTAAYRDVVHELGGREPLAALIREVGMTCLLRDGKPRTEIGAALWGFILDPGGGAERFLRRYCGARRRRGPGASPPPRAAPGAKITAAEPTVSSLKTPSSLADRRPDRPLHTADGR